MSGFEAIIGHEQIKEHLLNAAKLGKISHAYILDGEEGSGKKMIAAAFAKTVQCEKQGQAPCMECRSCKQAESRNNPDIIYVSHEKPGSIGVEDIRKQLNGDIMIKPYSCPFKIYIIDEADKLTVQAQNALLKTIEEPPAYAVIMLLTAKASALLPTILSRCVLLTLKPVKDSLIKEYLMKNLQIPDYRADLSTAFARGNVGKALKLASSESFDQIKEDALQLLKYLNDMEIHEIIESIKRINNYKMEINDYLDIIMIWYRDVLLFKATKDVNGLIFRNEVNYIKKQASKSSYNGLEEIIEALDKTKIRLNANVNFDLAMELLFLTIKEN